MYDLRWTMYDLERERAGGAGIAKQQQRWWAKQCLRTVRKAGAVADGSLPMYEPQINRVNYNFETG